MPPHGGRSRPATGIQLTASAVSGHSRQGMQLSSLGSLGLAVALLGCSAGGNKSEISGPSGGSNAAVGGSGSANPGPLGASGGPALVVDPSLDVTGGTGGASPADQVIKTLPAGFKPTEIGGYKLGDPLGPNGIGGGGAGAGGSAGAGGEGGGAMGDCGNILLGVVRDFKGATEGGHADFEADIYGGDVTTNLVNMALGMDRKPAYASQCEIGHPGPMGTCPFGAQTTNQANFDQWYHDTAGVNQAYLVSLYFAPQVGGKFTFQSLNYFPVDGVGFMGSAQADDGMMHNFHFTTELHTQFFYKGGETFQFQGDDDVWVYINNKLAVDVGGLHPMQLRTINLDMAAGMLGIQTGTIYSLDLFHAERHTTASTFRIDTNLSFVDCGTVIPDRVK